jgi:hypothetical protein
MDPGKSFEFPASSTHWLFFKAYQIGIFKVNVTSCGFIELHNRSSGGGFSAAGFSHQTKGLSLLNAKIETPSTAFTNLLAGEYAT